MKTELSDGFGDARYEPLIAVEGVRKTFGSTEALRGVDLAVAPGQIYGLLGPNGAGKSTLMGILSGVIAADAGTVTVGGQVAARDRSEWRRRLGLVPQQVALYETLSPLQNLAAFGAIYGLARSVVRERSEALLTAVGLWERRSDRVKDFSGGMRRRLNIAASLLHEPSCLLCDEPTVGVDPQSRNAIFDFLEARRAEGLTVVYTTHYMEEAARLCDRLAIIDGGRIIAEGTQDMLLDLLETGRTVRVRSSEGATKLVAATSNGVTWKEEGTGWLGQLAADFALSALYRAVEAAGVPEHHVQVQQPSLESLFLQLTGRDLRE